ncbi:MAG: type II toxin-antitoxin system VapC family toxin [Oscillospiraceae bacterium]|nr:type II toxin-antitoxin system VapC family toxin [Oscillospiraceae bacterium]
MKYLLDTHILIWHFGGSDKLSNKIKDDILFNSKNEIFISIVSLWEVAIKMNIGKYDFDGGFAAFRRLVKENECEVLPIKDEHMERLFALPLIHRDPFDRLIIATSIIEEMPLITADENIQKYNVNWVW